MLGSYHINIHYRLFFLRSIAHFFYTNLHELFRQFISRTNWVNSGKFMDNCWISCQVMADMKNVYLNLIIINLDFSFWARVVGFASSQSLGPPPYVLWKSSKLKMVVALWAHASILSLELLYWNKTKWDFHPTFSST